MSLNPSLLVFFEDRVTIEPYVSMTGAQVMSYGPAVTYPAIMQKARRRTVGSDAREVVSNVQVIIPNRVQVDTRSRLTLPSGFTPAQPAILGVEPTKFMDLTSTMVLC